MPRIIRTEDGTWHFARGLSCSLFTREDVVEVTSFHEADYDARAETTEDSEALPAEPTGDYQTFCVECYQKIRRWHQTRALRVQDLASSEDLQDVSWERGRHDPRQSALPDCELCGKPASGSEYSPELEYYACPTCAAAVRDAKSHQESETSTVPANTIGDTQARKTNTSPTDQEQQTGDNAVSEHQLKQVTAPADTESGQETRSISEGEREEPATHRDDERLESDSSRESTPEAENTDSRTGADDTQSKSGGQKKEETPDTGDLDTLMQLSGVGERTVHTLKAHGYTSVESLEGVSPAELQDLPGIGSGLAERIHGHVMDSPTESMALREIPGVGDRVVEVLTEHGYTSREDFEGVDPTELEQLPKIGTALSQRLVTEASNCSQ